MKRIVSIASASHSSGFKISFPGVHFPLPLYLSGELSVTRRVSIDKSCANSPSFSCLCLIGDRVRKRIAVCFQDRNHGLRSDHGSFRPALTTLAAISATIFHLFVSRALALRPPPSFTSANQPRGKRENKWYTVLRVYKNHAPLFSFYRWIIDFAFVQLADWIFPSCASVPSNLPIYGFSFVDWGHTGRILDRDSPEITMFAFWEFQPAAAPLHRLDSPKGKKISRPTSIHIKS